MRKLSIKELNMVYGGACIVLDKTDKNIYKVGLCNNDLREIVFVPINPNQEHWRNLAALKLCVKCWGIGTNKSLYEAIDDWVGYPNFCYTFRTITNQELMNRVRRRLGE